PLLAPSHQPKSLQQTVFYPAVWGVKAGFFLSTSQAFNALMRGKSRQRQKQKHMKKILTTLLVLASMAAWAAIPIVKIDAINVPCLFSLSCTDATTTKFSTPINPAGYLGTGYLYTEVTTAAPDSFCDRHHAGFG